MFCWKIDFFICGKTIKEHKEEWHIYPTQSIRQSILMSDETCMSNDVSDSLALNVKSRLVNFSPKLSEGNLHPNL